MRKYVFGTGLIGAITTGLELLRGLRDEEQPFTWRHVLIWLSWGITVALTVGAIVDTRREVLAERAIRAAGDDGAL
ncbi:hypothetical protein [Microbacterium mangrovi]|uniref:hypothetical protein n=1 Tax=Microbacterium mangrovi TaxID=1348253 RepID=UPI000690C412|nr:hypothetical protein [Microbacterium mangrovi]